MHHLTPRFTALLVSGFLLNTVRCGAQALFSDDFDTDSSTSWSIFDGASSGPSDFTAQFAFDYSAHGIPSAPNSTGGTTLGLKLTVNKDDTAATAAVSVYPSSMSFFGDFTLKFDMWLAYNGPAFGGSGSTEFATFGLNHTSDKVNWTSAPDSDGVWFTVCGEGGALRDYRAYVGEPGTSSIELLQVDGGFLDRDGDGTREFETAPDVFSDLDHIFPTPPFETRGAPGKRWVQVEVRQRFNLVTWLINGYVMAEHANLNNFTSGNIMLGCMDIFSSIANPKEENFVIYDNVRVEDLQGVSELPVVSIVATDATAAEPGDDTGTFTISRTGDTTAALTVSLRISGTASNGADYTSIPASATIAADATDTTITLTPINDSLGEGSEFATIALVGDPLLFELRNDIAATIELQDDGDKPLASVLTIRPVAYESIPALKGQFVIRFSNPNAADSTVTYTLSGTATNGVDYVSLPGSIVVPAGETNAVLDIVAIDNVLLDTNRTVIITLASNASYIVSASSNATVLIRNDDLPAGHTVYADNFDTDSSSAWLINKANASTFAEFGYDYNDDGVPPAPTSGSTTLGLKLYSSAALFTGLSVSPAGQEFTGDYRMRFDIWINYNGPLNGGGGGSTEAMSFGVGTSGATPQWAGGTVNSAMFAVTGDGGSSFDYRAYPAGPVATPATGLYAAGTQAGARNQSDPYYAEFGRESAPPAQLSLHPGQTGSSLVGAAGMAWHDVVIEKRGDLISWFIDGLRIATIDATGITLAGNNVFLGYFDTANGASDNPAMSFGLVDNLRVESLSLPRPIITAIRNDNDSVEIDFTAQAPGAPETFTLLSASTVEGPFTAAAGASITALGGNAFRATVPAAGNTQFYMIER